MPLDIAKSHTKTEINLSKPYHKGSLLIDLKSRSAKTLIDIKPIGKITIDASKTSQFKNFNDLKPIPVLKEAKQNAFNVQDKSSTLDFDRLNEFDDILNPFAQVNKRDFNRSASDIQIDNQSNIDTTNLDKTFENNTKLKQLGDVKKVDNSFSNISFSSLTPKINVAPLHSRSKTLVAIDQNRALAKKIREKRSQRKNQIPVDSHKEDLENFKTTFSANNFPNIENNDFFEFKTPPKFVSSDIPQFTNQANIKLDENDLANINLHELNKELRDGNLRQKKRKINKLKRYSASTLFTTVIIIFCTLFLTGNAQWMGKFGEKSVQADKNKNIKTINYEKWIVFNNYGTYSPPSDDLDNDGLNNYEEFLIGSIPINKNSCDSNITDSQNLLNLIDPKSCIPIDFNAPGQVQRFKDVLNITPDFIQKHQNQNLEPSQIINSVISVSVSSIPIVSDILPIPNIQNNVANSPTFIEASVKIQSPKISLENPIPQNSSKNIPLEQSSNQGAPKILEPAKAEVQAPKSNINSKAVQQYIDQYRSYDKYDNQIANPINANYFINMSEKYGVPLKYSLALARSESRFGTDQFNQDGSENRIGRHLNMYSIGLDDAGGSITYPSWEAGVDAFGRWYSKFENQGYSDCAKWRIYNPNGDYCQKIENLANQIENYINN